MKLLIITLLTMSFQSFGQDKISQLSKSFIEIRKELSPYRVKQLQTGSLHGSSSSHINGNIKGSAFLGTGSVKGSINGSSSGYIEGTSSQILQNNGEYYIINCYDKNSLDKLKDDISQLKDKILKEDYPEAIKKSMYSDKNKKITKYNRNKKQYGFRAEINTKNVDSTHYNYSFSDTNNPFNCTNKEYSFFKNSTMVKMKDFKDLVNELSLKQHKMTDGEYRVFKDIVSESKKLFILFHNNNLEFKLSHRKLFKEKSSLKYKKIIVIKFRLYAYVEVKEEKKKLFLY